MKQKDFSFTFNLSKSPKEAFELIKDVKKWWSGQFDEEIEGNTKHLGDEFTFNAGDGAHYSKQKLIELDENKKIVWLVTESELSFLKETNEWTGSKIIFEINKAEDGKSQITFIHQGLNTEIECYDVCTNAWMGYLQKNFLNEE